MPNDNSDPSLKLWRDRCWMFMFFTRSHGNRVNEAVRHRGLTLQRILVFLSLRLILNKNFY